MATKRKTYSYSRLMKLVLHDEEVYSWGGLYDKLGVMKWFDDRGVKPDVKYMFMSERLQQYITAILTDKYVTSKVDFRTPRYRRITANWDAVCYSPCSIDKGDCLIIDLTQGLKHNTPREYVDYMPSFDRKE